MQYHFNPKTISETMKITNNIKLSLRHRHVADHDYNTTM